MDIIEYGEGIIFLRNPQKANMTPSSGNDYYVIYNASFLTTLLVHYNTMLKGFMYIAQKAIPYSLKALVVTGYNPTTLCPFWLFFASLNEGNKKHLLYNSNLGMGIG